jgi:hypothetical protein
VGNSWSADNGVKGFYTMNDGWFDEYMFEIAAPSGHSSDQRREGLGAEPVVLPAWAPMGSLAEPKLAQSHGMLKSQTGQMQFTVGRGNPAECIQVGTMLGEAFVGVAEDMAGQEAQMMGMQPGDLQKMQQESMAIWLLVRGST